MKITVWRVLGGGALVAAAALAAVVFSAADPRDRWAEFCAQGRFHDYDALIVEIAAREKLDPALVKAIAWRESRLEDGRESADGARGLMQIGKGTAREWAALRQIETLMATDLFDARTNLQIGAWYFRQALDRWREAEEPEVFALADYAAGPEAVRRWSGDGRSMSALFDAMDQAETRAFVTAVRERAGRFRQHGL